MTTKKYVYFKDCRATHFPSLDAMREFAKDPENDGDYYIGVPATQRSYHRSRENMLKCFADSRDT